jgi:hypothetical protein
LQRLGVDLMTKKNNFKIDITVEFEVPDQTWFEALATDMEDFEGLIEGFIQDYISKGFITYPKSYSIDNQKPKEE